MVLLLTVVNLAAMGLSRGADAQAPAAAGTVHIVALGDSLTAGLGLRANEALPAVLQRLLNDKGHAVEIQNAGVSGDTTAGGLARLDWAVPEGTDAVILALGANDMLTGLDVARARGNLEAIIQRLTARHIPVLLAGMHANRTLGDGYVTAFDRIYPDLAAAHGLILYPFLLDGVALDPKLNQPDGIHPTAEGVRVIAERMLPSVEALVAQAKAPKSKAGP
jgi:acyl-CoA thioesterase-1